MPRFRRLPKPKPVFGIAPKPVRPRTLRLHGLFSMTYVRQHMMYDERWSPASLSDQFRSMSELLSKRLVFMRLEMKATQKKNMKEAFLLKRTVRDGRAKLTSILTTSNAAKIRNILMSHKDLQRLYHNMPAHQVDENIDQRTFVLRKERDRLAFRMDQMKNIYKSILLERARIENRMKYENEYVLEEERKSRIFRKKIEASKVRLKAIITINSTYQKMIQVIRCDTTFYEPIINSLQKDVEDQAAFIKNILYMGMPAGDKFHVLSEEYRQMEERSRRSLAAKLAFMTQMRNEKIGTTRLAAKHEETTEEASKDEISKARRYVRETQSMQSLKTQLDAVEVVIKNVKNVTLCSRSMEIFPRFHAQTENNFRFRKLAQHDQMGHENISTKKSRAEVLSEVLMSNLTQDEMKRGKHIRHLNNAINRENEKEKELMEYIKNRADAHVTVRYSLWNLDEILRHVGPRAKPKFRGYPNQYLKLPLLKFDMLSMYAVQPDHYEQSVENIMRLIKRKIHMLMKIIEPSHGMLSRRMLAENQEVYSDAFAETMLTSGGEDGDKEAEAVKEDDILHKVLNVPSRQQIKSNSARIVEELSKKDVDV